MANTPRIRFKGFTDDWEQRKLGEVFKEYSEKNHTELPALTIIQGGGTVLRDKSDRALQYDKSNLSTYKMVKKDDFIVHLRSFEGGLEKANSSGIISPAYHTFHGENTDCRFFYPFFRSRQFIDVLLKPHVYGIRDGKSIDIEGMKSILLPLPTYDEQRRIGNYIENLDHLITLHQRKCDETKKLKKFMLQKMFPKNGEKNPEIRFAGFTDDWEQRKLGEMCSIITKQTGFDYSATIKPSLVTTREPDTYSFIQNKDFEGLNINLDTDFYIPVSVAEKYPKIILDRPSLLISISGRIGNIALYTIEEKAFIGGAVGICKLKDVDAGKTAMYELMSLEGQKYFASLIKASSHANITVEDIRNIEVLIPRDKMEIIKLNEFIDNLSKLITLHQRKCDNLKLIKKFMLQNMFPKKG